jgi:hypothetical protein
MVRIFVYILNEDEPEDQGFCREGQNDGYGDSVYTCNLFKGIKR